MRCEQCEHPVWEIRVQLGNWYGKVGISKEQFPKAKDAHMHALDILCDAIEPDGTVKWVER